MVCEAALGEYATTTLMCGRNITTEAMSGGCRCRCHAGGGAIGRVHRLHEVWIRTDRWVALLRGGTGSDRGARSFLYQVAGAAAE